MSILFPGDSQAPTYERLVTEWPIVFARVMSPRMVSDLLAERIAADKLDHEVERARARAILHDFNEGARR